MSNHSKSREHFLCKPVPLRRQVRHLSKAEVKLGQAKDGLFQKNLQIEALVRELNCVFSFSNIIQDPDLPVSKIAEKLVEIISFGWRNPGFTCARVTLEEETFQTDNFSESPWRLMADIVPNGEKIGTIEVFYLGETSSDPFLPEEQSLLDDLAKRFSRVIRRKQAEETLREKEGYYREVFEKSNYGMAVTDLQGRFLDCNRAFLDLLGFASPDELQSVSYDEITPPEYHEQEKKIISGQTVEAGYSEGYEKEFIRKSGERIPVVIKVWMRRDMNQQPIGMYIIARDMIKRRLSQESLRKREQELAAKSAHLEEVNTALKVLLKHRDDDKAELEENVLANIRKLVMPYLEKLKRIRTGTPDAAYLQIVETNLNNIVSPFLSRLTLKYSHLSSRETQVAHLVREGKTTKEIAELLSVSAKAVDLYRGGIRKKLGLKRKKANLHSYLSSLQ